MADTDLVLAALAALLVKHAIADFFLQTQYQLANKGRYGHPGGLLHAGIHAALTAPVMLILPPPSAVFGAIILVAEFVVHYHLDWLKDRINAALRLAPNTAGFWNLVGLDQLGHGLTYVAIVKVLA